MSTSVPAHTTNRTRTQRRGQGLVGALHKAWTSRWTYHIGGTPGPCFGLMRDQGHECIRLVRGEAAGSARKRTLGQIHAPPGRDAISPPLHVHDRSGDSTLSLSLSPPQWLSWPVERRPDLRRPKEGPGGPAVTRGGSAGRVGGGAEPSATGKSCMGRGRVRCAQTRARKVGLSATTATHAHSSPSLSLSPVWPFPLSPARDAEPDLSAPSRQK